MSQIETKEKADAKFQEERRKFLKKAAYTAYATPVILSLLVDNANAAGSWDPSKSTGSFPPPPPSP